MHNLLDKETIAHAVLNGHLAVIKYLRTLGIELTSLTCAYAATNGHLELLKLGQDTAMSLG